MRWMRRLVIGVSEVLGLLFLLGATILGGAFGASIQRAVDPTAHRDSTLGFVTGAVIGFVPAALMLALLFAVFEIAANTRETNGLLRRIAADQRTD